MATWVRSYHLLPLLHPLWSPLPGPFPWRPPLPRIPTQTHRRLHIWKPPRTPVHLSQPPPLIFRFGRSQKKRSGQISIWVRDALKMSRVLGGTGSDIPLWWIEELSFCLHAHGWCWLRLTYVLLVSRPVQIWTRFARTDSGREHEKTLRHDIFIWIK